MFIKFTSEAQRILKKAKEEMQKLKHPFIGSEHVVLSILNNPNSFLPKLIDYGITYDIFYKEIINKVGFGDSNNTLCIYTPLLKRVLENAIIDVKEKGLDEIGVEDIFLSILDEGEGIANRILYSLGINVDGMYESLHKGFEKKISKKLSINEWGIDLVSKAKNKEIDPLIGRDDEVLKIMEILLRKNKNNPLLLGDAGVGKTAIVEELAKRIYEGKVPSKLQNYKIISISTASLVAGTKYRGEFEERVNKLLKELESNSNIILFIDEIHTLMGAGGAEGAIDASNILKPALARGKIKVIGATTLNEYKEHIVKDKAFNRRFQTVYINENTQEETREILYQLRPLYEEYHCVSIQDNILDQIVLLADKYIHNRNNPDKSLDVLDMVCTKVSLSKTKKETKILELKEQLNDIKLQKQFLISNKDFKGAYIIRDNELLLEHNLNLLNIKNRDYRRKVTLNDVLKVIENISRVPLVNAKKGSSFRKLEKALKTSITGQDDIIDKIVQATIKIFSGLKNNLPYSILLSGSSGCGKTYLVKEYARIMNIPLIRLDMSEYNEAHTISKIIGAPPGYIGYDNHDNVLEKIRNNPFCIILLDEIEKACKEVINLFLQILDEGIITDSSGNKVYFQNTIIFMTSNLESHNQIGFTTTKTKDSDIRDCLSTIFVNRINMILYLNKLSDENIKTILINYQKKLQIVYKEQGYIVPIDKINLDDIIKKSDSEAYGVRHAIKLLDERIDSLLIDTLLHSRHSNKQLN